MLLGSSWGHLEASWGLWGRSWGNLGASLGHLVAFLGPSWGHLAAFLGHLGVILDTLRKEKKKEGPNFAKDAQSTAYSERFGQRGTCLTYEREARSMIRAVMHTRQYITKNSMCNEFIIMHRTTRAEVNINTNMDNNIKQQQRRQQQQEQW